MKLEDQVTSLEFSKKLKELGIEQESLFYHVWRELDGTKDGQYFIWEKPFEELKESFSVFTVAELGELLPAFTKSSRQLGIAGGWFCHHDTNELNIPSIPTKRKEIMADSEADARAKMLIYLLENKLAIPTYPLIPIAKDQGNTAKPPGAT